MQTLCDDYADLAHAIDCQLPSRLVVTGKPAALQRALSNLVENALRYGVRVAIATRQEQDAIVIEITDQGPGIPELALEEVFTPFYRVEASRSGETGGISPGPGHRPHAAACARRNTQSEQHLAAWPEGHHPVDGNPSIEAQTEKTVKTVSFFYKRKKELRYQIEKYIIFRRPDYCFSCGEQSPLL